MRGIYEASTFPPFPHKMNLFENFLSTKFQAKVESFTNAKIFGQNLKRKSLKSLFRIGTLLFCQVNHLIIDFLTIYILGRILNDKTPHFFSLLLTKCKTPFGTSPRSPKLLESSFSTSLGNPVNKTNVSSMAVLVAVLVWCLTASFLRTLVSKFLTVLMVS